MKKKKDFNKIFKNGNIIRAQFYNCRYLRNINPENKIAIIAKKNIGNSVARNYEKRLVREFFRHEKHILKNNFYLIFILKQKQGSFLDKKRDFKKILSDIQHNDKE